MNIETLYWALVAILIVNGAGFIILFWTLLSILLHLQMIEKWTEWMAAFMAKGKND